jgi:hypothetical protein
MKVSVVRKLPITPFEKNLFQVSSASPYSISISFCISNSFSAT